MRSSAKPDEEYVVKFWMKDTDGFLKQFKESVWLSDKNSHEQAEEIFLKKYKGMRVEIISVIYQ